MVYNSFLFIWLFPIIFMVGNNLTVPYRKYFFLLASYGIYIYYNKWMTFTLIAVSLISYFFAKYRGKESEQVSGERPGERFRKTRGKTRTRRTAGKKLSAEKEQSVQESLQPFFRLSFSNTGTSSRKILVPSRIVSASSRMKTISPSLPH